MLTGAQRLCRKWGFTVQRKSLGNLTSNYLQQSETPTSVSTLLCSIYLIMAAGGGGGGGNIGIGKIWQKLKYLHKLL